MNAPFDSRLIRDHVELIHWLAAGCDGELVVCAYGEDPNQIDPKSGKPGLKIQNAVRRFAVGDSEAMIQAIASYENVPHANVYVPLHVVRKGLRAHQRGGEADILAVLGLVADMDADTGNNRGALPFDPSLVIESSPGNFQLVVLFDRPIDPAQAKPIAEALKIATGSDHGTADVAHVWRVPGTANWPNAAKITRGRPTTSAAVTLAQPWNGSLLPVEMVREALLTAAGETHGQVRNHGEKTASPSTQEEIDDIVRDGAPVKLRSDAFWDVVRWYFELKWAAGAVEELLAQHPNGIAAKYQGRLRQEIDRIFEKLSNHTAEAVAALVQRFNSKYIVVNEAGKAVIFQPGFDPVLKRRHFARLSSRDLHTLYMNETIAIGHDEKGRPVMKPVDEVWLRHPDRLQYINGVTFDPTGRSSPGVLNLWEGWAVKPAPGKWSAMQSHIRDVICDGDPIRFDYLMGWIANMLQRPAEQGEVAVVMQGGEGSGKGTLAKALLKITGQHGLAISNAKHLLGNFNFHLRDAVFLFADEAFFAGDRAHIGVLKSLISEPYLTVEAKYQNTIQAPNFLHVMMASNEDWVVPASRDARRFFVLEVPDTVTGDHAYFARIWAEMEDGGYEAMLYDLLAYDITTFNVRAVPTTEGLQRQQKFNLPVPEAWWRDCLERGYVFRSKLGLESEFAYWRNEVSTELLFFSYLGFARSRGERRLLTREDLGRFLTSMGAKKCRPRHGIVGEHIVDVDTGSGGVSRRAEVIESANRPPSYALGAIDQARAAFTEVAKIPTVWDDFGDSGDDDRDELTQRGFYNTPF